MLPPFLKKIRITTGFLYDSGQSILSHLDTLVRGRLVYRQTRRGIGQRSDLRKIKKPFSIGLGATHFSRQLWQSCSDKHNGQATLSGAMQRSDQRRQFLLFDVLEFVHKHCKGRASFFCRCACHFQQGLQVVFEVAVVRQSRLWFEVKAHLDVLIFYLKSLGEARQPSQRAMGEFPCVFISGKPKESLPQLRGQNSRKRPAFGSLDAESLDTDRLSVFA